MTRRFEWWYDLEPKITCDADVLGQTLPATIAGYPVSVHFPTLRLTEMGRELCAPDGVTSPDELPENSAVERYEWGNTADTDASGQLQTVWIRRIVVSAEIDQSRPDFESVVYEIDRATDQWWYLARSWVEIATGQRLTQVGHPAPQPSSTSMWFTPTQAPEGVKFAMYVNFASNASPLISFKRNMVSHYDPAPSASFDLMRTCFKQAELTNELPLAWKLIRDARALDIVGQFRRAVIDASAGAEIAMPVLIDSLLPSGLKRKLRKQLVYGTLGRLWETLLACGYPHKADIKTDLVDVRNAATHKSGSSVTADASEKAIEAAAGLVEDAFPLPHGMKRLW